MINAFIAGWPVSHSLSPVLHGFWLKRHAIAGDYRAFAVPPEGFAEFLEGLEGAGLSGGNVTVPHKERAFALCDLRDRDAEAIGAVNTVWLEAGKLCGTCTDSHGFAANLDDHAPKWRDCRTALVLGAGGASRAVIHALVSAGVETVHLVNRTRQRAQDLAEAFGPAVSVSDWEAASMLAGHSGVIVNTTTLGMGGQGGAPVDLEQAPADAIVADIVYTPLQTPLLAAAAARGLQTVDGLGMLLHQAVPGFERWFGLRPTVDAQLRAHMLAEIERRKAAQ